jgi:hypothetical protein
MAMPDPAVVLGVAQAFGQIAHFQVTVAVPLGEKVTVPLPPESQNPWRVAVTVALPFLASVPPPLAVTP